MRGIFSAVCGTDHARRRAGKIRRATLSIIIVITLLAAMVPVQANNSPDSGGIANASISNSSISTYIVVFEDTPQAVAAMQDTADLVTSYGGRVKYQYSTINGMAVSIPDDMASQLEALPKVRYVEKDQEVHALLNDSIPQIGADDVWAEGYTGKGVKVAVVDTGVDASHPDLNGGKVIAFADFVNFNNTTAYDDHGHGTHVSSIIAGTGQASGKKFRGVAPDASIMAAKVLDEYGGGYLSNVLKGMDWSVQNGAQVMSMSLGSSLHSQSMDDTVKNAVDHGVVVVIAAGNSGPGANTISCPGDSPDAITVGAVDKNDTIAYFSSRGPTYDGRIKPDVTNVGVNVVAARASGTYMGTPLDQYYTSASGTSMATPMTSGVVALMLEKNPHLSPAQVKNFLTSTSKPLGGSVPNNDYGWGRVQAQCAIDNITEYHSFYVSDTIPGTMLPGQACTVTITMMNSGIYDWSGANNTVLRGSLDASLYGATYFDLPAGTVVHPGEQYTWSFPMTAPAIGSYNLCYRMYDNTNPFGYGLNKSVRVKSIIEPGTIGFNNTSYSVLRSARRATITVNRTNGLDNTVSVNYSTVDTGQKSVSLTGTPQPPPSPPALPRPGTPGYDYTPANGTLTFAQDQSSATFNVIIENDYYYKGNTTINLTLSDPTGGATLGNSTAMLTVIDDGLRPMFEILPSSRIVPANQGVTNITIYCLYSVHVNASVNYTVGGGNATPYVDYVPANGTLDFPSGAAYYYYKTINITILNDNAVGPNKTVNVTLSNPTNGSILVPYYSTAVITITDSMPTVNYTYNLSKGWNLISIPIVPNNSSITTFFPPNVMNNISIIWEYNSSNSSNPWAYYTTMTDKYKQGSLRTVNERQGYWVNCRNNTTFTVNGSLPASPGVTLKSGWNLVGNPTTDVRQPWSTYSSAKIIWEYNSSNTSSTWAYYTTMTDKYKQGKLTQLKPGYGYWVRI